MNQKLILAILVVVFLVVSVIYYTTTQKEQETRELIKQSSIDNGGGEFTLPDEVGVDDITDGNKDTGIKKVDISDWKTFTNARFGYKFSYPPSANELPEILGPRKEGALYVDDNVTTLIQPPSATLFQVVFLDEEQSVEKYAEKVWLLNKEDRNPNVKEKKVGDISTQVINGLEVYQFTVSGSFKWADGGYILDQENMYVYVGTNGKVYQIRFPLENQELSQNILSTFELIGF